MNIEFFQKLTLLDFPGRTAATVFTYGCNLRCPFCHNASLVTSPSEGSIPEEEFFAFLDKRHGLLDGVCVTGGEPLLQKDILPFLTKIKEMGFAVKLDTNGCFPERLKEILASGVVDYVAMDIKNSSKKYPMTVGIESFSVDKIKQSAEILYEMAPAFELRTTAVATFHEICDFEAIGKEFGGDTDYYIQCFKDSGNTIEKGLYAHDEKTLEACRDAALPYFRSVSLRGI